MRSGDPGPDRPRGHREGPDLTVFGTRTVPARGGRNPNLFLRLFASRTSGGSLGGLPLPGLLGNMHFFFGLDLPRRTVPMLRVPAVRLPLGFPKQIGALFDTLVLLRVHSTTPPTFSRRQANPCRSRPQNAIARLGSAACGPRAGARRMTNRPVRKMGIAMPHLTTDDGISLYYEETGSGTPIVLVHEFADDYRGYEGQMRYFGRRYRCIAYNARGYPPSDVPEGPERYSQERARDDIRAVLDALAINKAHIVGISMGGFSTLHFGLAYPQRALSLVVPGCGYGAEPGKRQQFHDETAKTAALIESAGMKAASETYARGPTRVQFQNKDPRGWAEFAAHLAEHSTPGSAKTMRGVQARRPSLWDLTGHMRNLEVPTLIMTGDEDDPCLEPGLLMKRTIPAAALVVFPNTGHAVNLEEPELFNRNCAEFFHQVESGRWPRPDPRSVTGSSLGVR